jgi:hypothetical protein
MLFRMKSDVSFEADSIDDAFAKLEAHFKMLHDPCYDDLSLFEGGSIDISKVDSEVKS